MYNSFANSSVWGAKESATENTQFILDYCTATGYESPACTHCRSKSFVINGVTYYGQLPNVIEIIEICKNVQAIEAMDTSASANPNTNFSTDRPLWVSNQYNGSLAWYMDSPSQIIYYSKYQKRSACPVLEIPA